MEYRIKSTPMTLAKAADAEVASFEDNNGESYHETWGCTHAHLIFQRDKKFLVVRDDEVANVLASLDNTRDIQLHYFDDSVDGPKARRLFDRLSELIVALRAVTQNNIEV